ncbi:valacyclovir hydrolase isoform X2 [Dendrobates tinctorius]
MALCAASATLVSSAWFLHRVLKAPQLPTAALFYSTAITSGRTQVNGANLHYQRTGRGDHALLLLPGALGCSQTDFGPQLKFLNKEVFTIIGWDPRGYGLSIPPARDYPPNFFSRDAKDAVDLMQVLQLVIGGNFFSLTIGGCLRQKDDKGVGGMGEVALNFKKFSLLGWSAGGVTALIAAGSYPSLINKLVIWGTPSCVTEEDVALYNAVKDVRSWSLKMRKPMEDIYGKEYFANTFSALVEAMIQFASKPDGNICRHLLPLIGCPTLIIHGMKDPVVPKFHPQFLHEHIKNSR